jgi:hypothetical protein
MGFQVFRKTWPSVMSGCQNKMLTIEPKNMTAGGAAKSRCAFDENMQNEL